MTLDDLVAMLDRMARERGLAEPEFRLRRSRTQPDCMVLNLRATLRDGRRYGEDVLVPDIARRSARFDLSETLLRRSIDALAAYDPGDAKP